MSHAQRYMELAALTGGRPLDSSYHAAFYLLSIDPDVCKAAQKCVTSDGIHFTKLKRATSSFDDTFRKLIDIAHSLFSWTSTCKVTPFDVSRLGYPYMELTCNAFYIASGLVEVVAAPEQDNIVLDDTQYRRTKQFHDNLESLIIGLPATDAG